MGVPSVAPWAFTFVPGLPALALDLAFAGSRRVLSYGPIDPRTLGELAATGVELTTASGVMEAVRKLAWFTFDGILVAPDAPGGIALVKAVKLGAPLEGVATDDVRLAAGRQRVTPVFIAPLPGELDYAVILVAPGAAYMERTDRVPLVRAIARYDYSQLPTVKGRARFDPGVA